MHNASNLHTANFFFFVKNIYRSLLQVLPLLVTERQHFTQEATQATRSLTFASMLRGLLGYRHLSLYHYNDVTMSLTASQITSLTVVYSTGYSDADQRKRQSSASLAFVRGIHRGPVNSPHKGPVTRENVSIWWRHHDWCWQWEHVYSMACAILDGSKGSDSKSGLDWRQGRTRPRVIYIKSLL